MEISYEGIGQWAATFACGSVKEGQMVKLVDSGTVGPCGEGDAFCGAALSVSRDGSACTAALGGMVTASWSGETPAVGWCGLTADGQGGVRADGGALRRYLVAAVDESAKTVTFVL